MNKDRIEGKTKDVAGRIERQAGEWTGSSDLQVKGTAKQAEGKMQNAVGKVKDALNSGASESEQERQKRTDEKRRDGRLVDRRAMR